MIDGYYRNGKLFLAELLKRKDDDKYFGMNEVDEILKDLSIDDDFIKENLKEPAMEFVGRITISNKTSERDILKAFKGKGFPISSRSYNAGITPTFFKTSKGECSYCGNKDEVLNHVSYIFPFFRKIDSITPDNNKLKLCKKCAFTLYSGMAYLYQKGAELLFFFDSYNFKSLKKINHFFKKEADLLDPSNKNRIRKFDRYPTYHPYDTIFIIFFEFVKRLHQKNLLSELEEVSNEVRLLMSYGSGQIYHYYVLEGNLINKLTRFFRTLMEKGKEFKSEQNNIPTEDLILSRFFINLRINKGKFEEDTRLRNLFVEYIIKNEKINFEIINEIIMRRIKDKTKPHVPPYYKTFITTFLEVFGLSEEKDMFERLNGLGYALGNRMKGTNLESYIWEVFRARGAEELYNVLVELQLKLKDSMDLRPLKEHEDEWRKVKAIIVNGMANALYGGGKSE